MQPSDYQNGIDWLEDYLLGDDFDEMHWENSETKCLSFFTSHAQATASCSNVDFPWSIDPDENLYNTWKCETPEISNPYNDTKICSNLDAVRSEKSRVTKNIFNLAKVDDYGENTQPDDGVVPNDNCWREFNDFYEVTKVSDDNIASVDGVVPNDNCDGAFGSGPSEVLTSHSLSSLSGIVSSDVALLNSRFKVNSFTVPEFFIEVAETAPVLQMKLQLDVTLKPEVLQAVHTSSLDSCAHKVPCDTYQPLTWCVSSSPVVQQVTMAVVDSPIYREAIHVVPRHPKIEASENCLVMDVNAINMNPGHPLQKSATSKKRRKTKVFSLSEVEALVQKVGELGTGRWQKIKEEAFGNDTRRTYMDVKDKWRSLVKTAQLPANKRKGIFLPQGLLQRVLDIETQKPQYKDIQK